ncbi:glycosyltransferase [Enterobacter hormaechei subsp. hoffmannii]|jgi:glycosyltransferase involved in cell wall biosynthesis|uniref:glycosyltransferase n=1 Tax=Enterobacter hormaechei TaxID=158836 RepID=UPI0022354858|nr:glycosyltransferase [Enterobacter hormaechei]MCW4713671.1 glycosyltransferase [Enterobacter hormaechei subsp. hoffmannii]HCM9400234.1 glycosyltransferase [Enterobacter hormaechei subsp. steigerwaltii]HCM9401839.1 glycosyltransferase [Enterobacter hormaechei subsp. steigerwaltii]
MKNKIDVSIIIPAYNAAATVGCLVNKILSETHVAIELIVVDDGSTDGTGNIIRQIHDDRLILIEQANQGVYAARNAALALHQGEWVLFLDADDDIADGFIEKRWQAATASQADVMIFNGWHSGADHHRRAVHRKQPYGATLSGHEWIRHCVTRREWPHYLWLQMVRSSYVRQHSLRFQPGRSHKDILWTVHLAASNGRFCVLDVKDYIYISTKTSITHRPDYYDVRAISYVEVIAEIIQLAEQNKKIKVFLYRHALVEARHFLGLYRNRVGDKSGMKDYFKANIFAAHLFRGISSFSDVFFFIKLLGKLF